MPNTRVKKANYSGEQIGLGTENIIKNLINDLNMKGLIFENLSKTQRQITKIVRNSMAALKLSLIQKYKLENAYTYVYSTGFLSPACSEQGARALLLTRREEAPGAYTVLVLSETGIQEIELGEDFLDRENEPVLFSYRDSFGVIKAKKEIAYYTGDFSSPEIIPIKNGFLPFSKVLPDNSRERHFQTVSDGSLIPVCFEKEVYYGLSRCFAILDFNPVKKEAKWKCFSEIEKNAFTHHDDRTKDAPKIDSLKMENEELYAFTSGESTGSVNKWGMDYYALAKISSEGKVKEKLLESEQLKAGGKKSGVNGTFTHSDYLILTPLFNNDDWKGKQKLFSLSKKEYLDIIMPRGMTKHSLHNICGELCLTALYDRGLKEIGLCKVEAAE